MKLHKHFTEYFFNLFIVVWLNWSWNCSPVLDFSFCKRSIISPKGYKMSRFYKIRGVLNGGWCLVRFKTIRVKTPFFSGICDRLSKLGPLNTLISWSYAYYCGHFLLYFGGGIILTLTLWPVFTKNEKFSFCRSSNFHQF